MVTTGRIVGLSVQLGRDRPSRAVTEGPVPGPAAGEATLHDRSAD